MKIDSLELESFKGFGEISLNIEGKTTVFFGENGVGKSSILEAINILFAPLINRIVVNYFKFKQKDNLDEDDIKFRESEATLLLTLHMGENGLEREEFALERSINKKNNKSPDKRKLDLIANCFLRKYILDEGNPFEENNLLNMPIFVNYGSQRAVRVVSVKRITSKHDFSKLSAFEQAIENVIDFRLFFEWFRERQEYENSIKIEENLDYIDRQLNAVKIAIIQMLGSGGFTDLKIMFHPLRMVATKNNENLKVEQLSDGEKCTLAMLGDLARRLAIANPSMKNPLEGSGIVLIDEIELHLHPTWQAKIISNLQMIFPNIQFIITTHSPKVLGELTEDTNVFELFMEDNRVGARKISTLIGWDMNYILEDIMDTNSMNIKMKKKYAKMFELIYEGSLEEAKEYADELEAITSNLNPEIVRARILIKRKRAGL